MSSVADESIHASPDARPARGKRWLSPDPDVAWTERFVLLYTPIWILAVGVVQLGGILDSWGDPAYLAFSIAIAAPLVVYPLLSRPNPAGPGAAERPWWDHYWVRLNLWVAILTFVGNYLGTHYFFQSLGMTYRFPTEWTLEATVAGSDRARVPIFLYLLTQAYFMTYHVVMCVVYRRLVTTWSPGPLVRVVAVAVIAYLVAFAETFAMANPLLEQYFEYSSRSWMLSVGSTAYAMYFIVSLPMTWRMARSGTRWSLGRVALDSLAASMLIMLLLDLWTQLVPVSP